MGLFNPFYYISYFIKCIIRNFSKRYFKIILLFLIITIIFVFYNKSFCYSSDNLIYKDINDKSYFDWLHNLNEYKSGNYYYVMGQCYDGNFDVSSRIVSYILFIDKNDFNNNDVKAYWNNTLTPYSYLFYLCFNKSVNIVQYTDFSTSPYSSLSSQTASTLPFRPAVGTDDFYFDSNLPVIYTNSSLTDISYSSQLNPYFVNSKSELETFNFDYFTINGGTMPYKNTVEGIEHIANLSLDYNYKGVRTNIDLKNYLQVVDNTWIINIPYNVINNNVLVKNGEDFYYRFTYSLYGTNYSGGISISGTYNLTTDEENTINSEGNKQLLNQLQANQNSTNQKLDEQTSAINNQTNKIQDLNDNISDSNVDDFSQNSLPSDSTNDITKDGVNGIFTSIYNAFCTGEPVNIDFPIPNTNKSISLSPSYVYDSLSNFGGGFVVSLIQTFWWYLISRFIVKDIVDKINKIKSGNIEDIETTNIRGDML